jgi:hypothetical protein
VPATGRLTIDATADLPELLGHSFSMIVTAAGGAPIMVERSMYWDGASLTWSGGSNAVGTGLP